MATIARLNVALGMDSSDFDNGVKGAMTSAEGLANKLAGIGKNMTAGITLPIVGAAGAALKFSTDFNSSMANVAALGVPTARVNELKTAVQDMAITTGQSTEDLAGGLYQTVSAFGDTADTAKILEINAKAAAAGLSTVPESIALTSAVTKGYGDTSANAVQQVSDLALQTVALGQTTFPELAASIGRVTPLAASLGVTQEELFAVMATGTGVTGGAAEVSTQLRGVLQSLMAPTEDMTSLMGSMGYETGDAMLKGEGLEGTISAIVKAAADSGTPLQKYLGSIEGQTLALALAGPQAEAYAAKLEAMGGSMGATEAAFKAQTQGINKVGFTMKQLGIQATVIMQKLGDGLAPALGIVLDKVTPLVDYVLQLADWFANADANTQLWGVALLGVVAAIGPLLMILPGVVSAVGVIGSVLAFLVSPIGLVIAAVGLLATAWVTNFGDIQGKFGAVVNALKPGFDELKKWIDLAMKGDFSGLQVEIGNALNSVQVAVANFKWSDYMPQFSWDGKVGAITWGNFVGSLDWEKKVLTLGWGDYVFTLDWGKIITTFGEWSTYVTALDWGSYITTALDWATYVFKLEWSVFVAELIWLTYVANVIWTDYIQPIDWGAIVTKFMDWATYVKNLDWGLYVTKLTDWGVYVGKVSWTAILPTLTSWGTYITKLDWATIGLAALDWATWIPAILWSVFIAPIKWSLWLVSLAWNTVIDPVFWSNFIPAITNWDNWIKVLSWAAYINPMAWITFIATVRWEDYIPAKFIWAKFVEKVNWMDHIPGLTWPTFDPFVWSNFVDKLGWPEIKAPSWEDFIDSLQWPEIHPPSWSDFIDSLRWPDIPSFPGWAEILAMLGWGGPPAMGGSAGNNNPSANNNGGLPIDVTPPPPVYNGQGLPTDFNDPTAGGAATGRGGVVLNNYGDLNNAIDLAVLKQMIREVMDGAR